MKKNKMMRLASSLLVAVLLTSSVISGTFAKYVTSDSAQDSARVAKFGVVVTATGNLFADTYKKAAENTPVLGGSDQASLSVMSEGSLGDNVVAPGTKNTDGFTFTVKGTPEVDVALTVELSGVSAPQPEYVFLDQKNDLPDMTTGNQTDDFDNTAIYEPIKFVVTKTVDGGTPVVSEPLTMTGLYNYFNAASEDVNFGAKEELDVEYNITWAWDFDASGAGTYDKQDTLLGDLAAGTTLTPAISLTDGTDYNLTTDVKIAITVTQID